VFSAAESISRGNSKGITLKFNVDRYGRGPHRGGPRGHYGPPPRRYYGGPRGYYGPRRHYGPRRPYGFWGS